MAKILLTLSTGLIVPVDENASAKDILVLDEYVTDVQEQVGHNRVEKRHNVTGNLDSKTRDEMIALISDPTKEHHIVCDAWVNFENDFGFATRVTVPSGLTFFKPFKRNFYDKEHRGILDDIDWNEVEELNNFNATHKTKF